MKEGTGVEIERARQGLEHSSATILGRIMFAFSRLDLALALHIVWSNDGSQLEELTRRFKETSFHDKCDFLKDLVTSKYNSHEANVLYGQWFKDADATRTMRNELVHGRWGIDPVKNQVVNVIGLPTSPEQRSKRYTTHELKDALAQLDKLEVRLAELREKWPV